MTRPDLVRRPSLVALVTALVLALLGLTAPAALAGTDPTPPAKPAPVRPTDPIAHDPTMVREGGWYYVAITGDSGPDDTYIPMKRSRDLLRWEELAPAMTELPTWALDAIGATAENAPRDAWAPDLAWTGTEWRLYYAISRFGTNNSVIGLLTTPTLANPVWTDEGLVVQSKPGVDTFNAIDPNVTVDAEGKSWLTFGSFFSGTQLVRLDAATGKPAAGATPVQLAQRETPPNPNAAENATIVPHDGAYYLFLSFDYCCRSLESDYRTVVGRATSITGPYLDKTGQALLLGKGGTEVMRGYNEFVGAGGADILTGTGPRTTSYVVNHYYDAATEGAPRLNVRPLSWADDGWPVISDPVNPSRSAGHGDAYVQIRPRDGGDSVVEDAGCGYEGANIALWTDLGNDCQQWQLSDRGHGTRITNRFSNNVAEVAACQNFDGGNVAQWGWVGFLPNNDCQRWSLTPGADGWTAISSVLAGSRAWTVQGAADPGANVAVSTQTGGAEQQFRFQPVGQVLLASPTSPTETLGVDGCRDSGAAKGPNGKVRFQERDERACQTWVVKAVAGTATYTVTSPRSGSLLSTGGCQPKPTDGLRLVDHKRADAACTTWTLSPTDDGTWTLASAGTSQAVRLLLP